MLQSSKAFIWKDAGVVHRHEGFLDFIISRLRIDRIHMHTRRSRVNVDEVVVLYAYVRFFVRKELYCEIMVDRWLRTFHGMVGENSRCDGPYQVQMPFFLLSDASFC